MDVWGRGRVGVTSLDTLPPPLPYSGFTSIYITPGYKWKVVDAMITNFHLPRSTLLAMVGSFMGMDFVRETYAQAIRAHYRFYSFGDAMFVIGNA